MPPLDDVSVREKAPEALETNSVYKKLFGKKAAPASKRVIGDAEIRERLNSLSMPDFCKMTDPLLAALTRAERAEVDEGGKKIDDLVSFENPPHAEKIRDAHAVMTTAYEHYRSTPSSYTASEMQRHEAYVRAADNFRSAL